MNSSNNRVKKDIVVPLLVLATIFAGMLSPLQSAVNGQLGNTLHGDGNAAAVISFGSGLVVMTVIILARHSTRAQFASIPRKMRAHDLPWWNWIAGICGAMVVFSEGASASVLGVATFQTTLISGLVISGLLCDRFGIGVDVKQPFNFARILGAVCAIAATILVVSPNWSAPKVIGLAVLPFLAGILAGWQPAGNSAIAKETGSMLVSITWNFIVGFFAGQNWDGPSQFRASPRLVDVLGRTSGAFVDCLDGIACAWTGTASTGLGFDCWSADWFSLDGFADSPTWCSCVYGNCIGSVSSPDWCRNCNDPFAKGSGIHE